MNKIVEFNSFFKAMLKIFSKYFLFFFLQFFYCQDSQLTLDGLNLSWTDLGDSIQFSYRTIALATDNVWIGIGFSKDNLMGNDDMVICKISNNTKTVERHFSLGKFRPPLLDPERPKIGLTKTNVFMYGPEMTCEFTRLKSMEMYTNYYDIRKSHYLLFAKGLTDKNGKFAYIKII